MTEFVRIKAENGQELSVPATYPEAFGVKPLSKQAVDRFGRPLPTKSPLSLRQSQAEASAEAKPSGGTVSKEKN